MQDCSLITRARMRCACVLMVAADGPTDLSSAAMQRKSRGRTDNSVRAARDPHIHRGPCAMATSPVLAFSFPSGRGGARRKRRQ